MKTAGLWAMAGLGQLLLACSGRLDFDPQLSQGQQSTTGSDASMGGYVPRTSADAATLTGGHDAVPPSGWSDAAPAINGSPDAGWPDLPKASVDRWDATTPDAPTADLASASNNGAVCPTGTNVLDSIFVKKCGTCHGSSSPALGLDLVSPGLGARLVNVKSTCGNKPLIVPGATPTGQLFDKLAGPVKDCGVQMPAGSAALTATELACVQAWALDAIRGSQTGEGDEYGN